MLKDWISSKYLANNKVNDFNRKFINAKPFSHVVLKEFFIKNKLKLVLNALMKEEFTEKNSDLYQFKQTINDIKSADNNLLYEFYLFFSSKEFLDYINKITGIKINEIDMSGFIYGQSDYLLPHDDQLEGRKIAYVVNLSEKFTRKDGGRLQFFSTKDKKPFKTTKSYSPNFGNLVLFKVSDISFHQVEEVMSRKERISFAGWFHEH